MPTSVNKEVAIMQQLVTLLREFLASANPASDTAALRSELQKLESQLADDKVWSVEPVPDATGYVDAA